MADDSLTYLLSLVRDMPREAAVERIAALYLEARSEADAAARRAALLQGVANRLARALEPEQVAQVIITDGLAAIDASGGGVWTVEGNQIRMIASVGYEPMNVAGYLTAMPIDTPVPVARACKTGVPVLLENREQWMAQFPLAPLVTSGHKAWAALPLMLDDRPVGCLGASFSEERQFTARDREFLVALASQCAQALHRAQLFAAERIARGAAEKAVLAREEFLSIASHELRTPLTPLMLQLGIIRRDVANTPLEPKIAMAQRQTERLGRLVGNLLDVARIGAGKLEMERDPVDLGVLVAGVIERLEEEIRRQGCAVTVEVGKVPGHWDAMRLEQVVSNLVGNAIKYGAGQPVEVSLTRQAGVARLSIRDHGIGIPPEAMSRLFGRFERAVSAREFGGLGLGLYIARQIVEAHGGTIVVNSALGKGATFTVELPLEIAAC